MEEDFGSYKEAIIAALALRGSFYAAVALADC